MSRWGALFPQQLQQHLSQYKRSLTMYEISYQKMVWVLLPVLVMNYFFSFMGSLPVAEVEPVLLELGDLGSLKGTVLKSAFNNKVISSFRGIPFAKPPIKNLRFQDPEPYGAWEGELDATEFASCCVQGKSSGSEDCLYLNVYTVPNATGLPVMVFLHGGGFTNGCSSPYGPEYLLDREDVILVTVNYRLGVFGFISTEDEVAPGNYGLMDQNLALRWINSYITYFGGDPARVTLFGQSAGAYAVHHHVLSPLSAGLIERAILESGTSLNARALIEGGRATLLKHAKLLNYTGSLDDSAKLMKFMASKTTDQLIQTQMKLPSLAGTPISYGPRVDSERAEPFLPEHPIALIQNRNETIPIMAGVNQDEGALTAAALLATHSKNLNLLIDEYKKYLPDMLEFHATSNDTSTLAEKIWQQYIGTTDRNRMDRNLYRKVSQMMGDGLYYLGFVRTMDILPDKTPRRHCTPSGKKGTFHLGPKH